ncbi:hypothetical protein E1A91_A01G246500v1, partial [Gossypium mustelinum]
SIPQVIGKFKEISRPNAFTRSIPSFIGNLQQLESLDLSSNNLRSEIPLQLANLNFLSFINITNNKLVGPIPTSTQLRSFPEASFENNTELCGPPLKIIGREISSPIDDSSSLFRLQHLRQLNLALNQFMTAFPTIFDKLENLRYLNLSEAGFTGQIPIEISRLTRLVTLDLSIDTLFGTPLKLEKPNLKTLVQNLTKLRFLYLDGVNISATGNEWCQALSPLTELQVLSMSDCYLSGPIHSSLSRLRSLSVIRLDRNNLSGLIPQFFTKFPNLTCLSLSSVNFSGPIPSFSSSINLRELILALNQLNGTIHSTDWTGFSKLEIIGLGNNKLSGTISPTFLSHNQLMAALVTFMGNFQCLCLNSMTFQKTKFMGEIPDWIWKPIDLARLNLFQNFLLGFERPLKNITSSLEILDLHGNQLQGEIPILSNAAYLDYSNNNFNSVLPAQIGDSLQYAFFFSLSNNNIQGSIPESICNSKCLEVLDLSNNSLSGPIPQCLFQISRSLWVLNLRRSNLSGIISDTFSKSCRLQTLNLNQNQLEGKVSKSLVNCKMVKLLDIGNNHINNSFPCHLKNIATLRVLVLRSNKFNGHIDCSGNNSGWPMLHILDLASNNFSGKLHLTCLRTLDAMQSNPDKNQSELQYLQFEALGVYVIVKYQDAITITTKGLELELVKIPILFTSIGISCNNFEGSIPDVIGKFKELHCLNFSHNAFTGPIPSSFGNLQELESLDLSSNSLRSEIPLQLANLNFLSCLNVSNNKLVGPIPTSTQLRSFSEASFENLLELSFSSYLWEIIHIKRHNKLCFCLILLNIKSWFTRTSFES